jgi:hypothetical protein
MAGAQLDGIAKAMLPRLHRGEWRRARFQSSKAVV